MIQLFQSYSDFKMHTLSNVSIFQAITIALGAISVVASPTPLPPTNKGAMVYMAFGIEDESPKPSFTVAKVHPQGWPADFTFYDPVLAVPGSYPSYSKAGGINRFFVPYSQPGPSHQYSLPPSILREGKLYRLESSEAFLEPVWGPLMAIHRGDDGRTIEFFAPVWVTRVVGPVMTQGHKYVQGRKYDFFFVPYLQDHGSRTLAPQGTSDHLYRSLISEFEHHVGLSGKLYRISPIGDEAGPKLENPISTKAYPHADIKIYPLWVMRAECVDGGRRIIDPLFYIPHDQGSSQSPQPLHELIPPGKFYHAYIYENTKPEPGWGNANLISNFKCPDRPNLGLQAYEPMVAALVQTSDSGGGDTISSLFVPKPAQKDRWSPQTFRDGLKIVMDPGPEGEAIRNLGARVGLL
jgi:hypothetical protein